MNTTTIPKQEFLGSIERFQANIKAAGLDACPVHANESDMANERYLSEYWPTFEAAALFVPAEGESALSVGTESDNYAAQWSVFANIEKMIEYREFAEAECPGIVFASYRDIVAKYTPVLEVKKLGIVSWAITPLPVHMSLN
ncbi:aminopeptidase P family N-terminal domain-containing protein [Mariniphaga sediminis]|uniref:aminopeptidase P family N-terminal domain-containing protein n=1 Tax=Mariniphaga sediminis TaxID=1628158 RepID=UPI003565FDCC